MVGQFFTEGKRATSSLFSSSKTSGQVSIDWTGKKKKMAHGNYHWLLFTIYLNTPHDQQQYTLRKEKKALHERRERYNAFRISADLLHAVVLRGVGTYWVKWSGFFFNSA